MFKKYFTLKFKYLFKRLFIYDFFLKLVLTRLILSEVVRQGKLFQSCTHLLYCSALSLGANVNTRRMAHPDMGSIFHIKNQWNILVRGNYYVNYQNYQNLMLLTSSDTKQTLLHLFLFTNSAQRELFSICTNYAEYTQLQLTFLAL